MIVPFLYAALTAYVGFIVYTIWQCEREMRELDIEIEARRRRAIERKFHV